MKKFVFSRLKFWIFDHHTGIKLPEKDRTGRFCITNVSKKTHDFIFI